MKWEDVFWKSFLVQSQKEENSLWLCAQRTIDVLQQPQQPQRHRIPIFVLTQKLQRVENCVAIEAAQTTFKTNSLDVTLDHCVTRIIHKVFGFKTTRMILNAFGQAERELILNFCQTNGQRMGIVSWVYKWIKVKLVFIYANKLQPIRILYTRCACHGQVLSKFVLDFQSQRSHRFPHVNWYRIYTSCKINSISERSYFSNSQCKDEN